MKKLNKGFTLVEMLIVVTIIGIIIGIGVPALRDAKSRAVSAKQDAILATVATAKTRYALDSTDSGAAFNATAAAVDRFNFLAPYILVKGVAVTSIPVLLGTGGVANNIDVGFLPVFSNSYAGTPVVLN